MSKRLVYFNGEFVPELEARISIFDCALMYGDMVFEMTRSFKQQPYRLRAHLERLYASMRYVEIDSAMQRAILVLKTRGSDHAKEIRRFELREGGIVVGTRFEGREALLSGSPRSIGRRP